MLATDASCKARIVARNADSRLMKRGQVRLLCGGDPLKKDNLKDAVLRLVPYVTARKVLTTRIQAWERFARPLIAIK